MTIHCDGGARGNPGPAACAFVVYDDQHKLIFTGGKYLGQATNNQAEYEAVISALEWLCSEYSMSNNQYSITFYLDSELVVKQLKGIYKVKDLGLKNKKLAIEKLVANCKIKVENYVHIPRESNSVADKKVNQILDTL